MRKEKKNPIKIQSIQTNQPFLNYTLYTEDNIPSGSRRPFQGSP